MQSFKKVIFMMVVATVALTLNAYDRKQVKQMV